MATSTVPREHSAQVSTIQPARESSDLSRPANSIKAGASSPAAAGDFFAEGGGSEAKSTQGLETFLQELLIVRPPVAGARCFAPRSRAAAPDGSERAAVDTGAFLRRDRLEAPTQFADQAV